MDRDACKTNESQDGCNSPTIIGRLQKICILLLQVIFNMTLLAAMCLHALHEQRAELNGMPGTVVVTWLTPILSTTTDGSLSDLTPQSSGSLL
mmetsp:Transcript_3579/g.5478  ORF Transcript_3579/g.5478 Transcript_3579/m.5478 type:complete len:93 (-) Transcript_3579:142-420(-)